MKLDYYHCMSCLVCVSNVAILLYEVSADQIITCINQEELSSSKSSHLGCNSVQNVLPQCSGSTLNMEVVYSSETQPSKLLEAAQEMPGFL